MVQNDLLHERAAEVQLPCLDQQAFPKVPRTRAQRFETLDKVKSALHVSGGKSGLLAQLVKRGPEIAIVVQITDDPFPSLDDVRVRGGKMELPPQMIAERREPRKRLIVRGQFLVVGFRGAVVTAVSHFV